MTATSFGAASGAAEEEGVLAGTVEAVQGPNTVRLSTADGTTVVHFAEGSTFWRDEPVSLDAFVPGDAVSVTGEQSGEGAFAADYMVTNYYSIETDVNGRSGDRLETGEGPMKLTSRSQAQEGHELRAKPLHAIGRGDRIVALGRMEPSSGEFVALRVGVRGGA